MEKAIESLGRLIADGERIVRLLTPQELQLFSDSVDKLRTSIIEHVENPEFLTLTMHVNLSTARAELIPIPTEDNMVRFKNHFKELPNAVQEIVKKSISI